jgi:hypothetical protein
LPLGGVQGLVGSPPQVFQPFDRAIRLCDAEADGSVPALNPVSEDLAQNNFPAQDLPGF